MNEHLYAGTQCFRILQEFEKAPRDCRQTAFGAALDAYLCPSGQPTLWLGCCFWPDGRAVQMGDTIEPGPEADAMMAYNLRYCEEYVKQHVTVELDQNQFDACVSFRFNTRESTLRNSSRLLPAINAKEWQKAAIAFTEFVYGASTFDGKPYQEALRGLLRRRLWEGLIFLGLDPTEAVKDKDVALPSDMKLLNSGVYRDMIRTEGLTTLNQVKMRATPLAQAELVLTQPAPPLVATTRVPDGKAEQPGADPQSQSPAASAPKVSPAPTPPSQAKPSEAKPTATPAAPRTAPVPAPLPPVGDVIVRKGDPIPPSPEQQRAGVNGSTTPGIDPTSAKSMLLSRRFWGLLMIITGRVVFAFYGADTLLKLGSDPLISEMFANVMVLIASSAWEYCGECLHTWGKARARRALK